MDDDGWMDGYILVDRWTDGWIDGEWRRPIEQHASNIRQRRV